MNQGSTPRPSQIFVRAKSQSFLRAGNGVDTGE
nr:MAG TPA: hypothetical protein [Caudoviricetes sp.]